MTRTQFPVVASFALTVNKAQGLTLKECAVIHLVGGKRFWPAAKHGLPFVAWARSESFAMAAFKGMPPWGDSVKGRRQDFKQRLQAMHTRTLAKHNALKTPQLEAQAHALWTERQALQANRHKPEGPRLHCPACEAGA